MILQSEHETADVVYIGMVFRIMEQVVFVANLKDIPQNRPRDLCAFAAE